MSEIASHAWASPAVENHLAPYAECSETDAVQSPADRFLTSWYGQIWARTHGARSNLAARAAEVVTFGETLATLSDIQLRLRVDACRHGLLGATTHHRATVETFAIAREITGRVLGYRHHQVQVMGALALFQGRIVEMQTGEGKTITALLAAAAGALSGVPVHIVTVNDYLARRDAEDLRPIYESLGLRVGLVVEGQTAEERRAAYGCDVTYCTNKTLVFDYLRDRIALGQRRSRSRRRVDEFCAGAEANGPLLLRGLHFAILDEVDSILIDEARTPLILSAGDEAPLRGDLHAAALAIARSLSKLEHFQLLPKLRTVELTPQGEQFVADQVAGRPGIWRSRHARNELITQALCASHVFERDKDYIVAEGKVQIIDEYTGRVMPDRSWERGLHQMIEAKENCDATAERRTIARITYQRFFQRYLKLAGMSGTVTEIAGEIYSILDRKSIRIPTNRPVLRRNVGTALHLTSRDKWRAVVERAGELGGQRLRSVLIGTRSVAASEHLSQLLSAAGLAHVVLNARQTQEEATIIAQAGQPGRITVATNMAGRGTDIKLSEPSRAAGGLHVILTEFHESARIDRQLFGRTGRQGDPGTHEAIVSLDDEIFERFAPIIAHWARTLLAAQRHRLILGTATLVLRHTAQRNAEHLHRQARLQTVAHDRSLDRALAFSGKSE
jgi:preprotein translocase subunit SecA